MRQLGIAADAAETAYREACEVDRHQTPTLCSGDEEAAVGERAPRPHDHAYTAYVAARDAHRAVAAAALTEQEARRAVMGSSDPVLELNRENLLAAWMAHPMRERGLTVYVASHLRGRIEELVADELGDPEGEYRIGWSEDSRLSDWDLRTML